MTGFEPARRDGRLGGRVARRPLHFFWLLDTSGSMAADGKIQALDFAVRDGIPALRDAAAANPGVELLVRAVAFGSTLRHLVSEPTPVEALRWPGVTVEDRGLTELGPALAWLAGEMAALGEANRGFAPAVVLVSDGQPTDLVRPTYREGLAMLLEQPWGKSAVRLSVAIGSDANTGMLAEFMAPSPTPPLRAGNPDQLAEAIRFVSIAAVQSSTVGRMPSVTVPTTSSPPTEGSFVW